MRRVHVATADANAASDRAAPKRDPKRMFGEPKGTKRKEKGDVQEREIESEESLAKFRSALLSAKCYLPRPQETSGTAIM